MGSGTRPRWFPGFSRHRRSASKPDSPGCSSQQSTPVEFICPISDRLMADPVILPNGQTFERACIVACLDLGIDLPQPPKDAAFPPPPPLSPATQLVPNFALRSAIVNWCDSHGISRPIPIEPAAAARLVQSPTAAASSSSCETVSIRSASPSASSSSVVNVEKDDQFYDSFPSPPSVPELSHPPKHTFSSSFSSSASSAPSTATTSSEITAPDDPPTTPTTTRTAGEQNPPTGSPFEEQILGKLKSPDATDQEQGLLLLRRYTRELVDQRAELCTARILAALRPFLLSRNLEAQSNAVAALVNLSLHQPNKIPILRSGAVPPLVSALRSDHYESRSHAAAAVFSLAVEEDNKAAIGALGALPRLLALLSRPGEEAQTCRDAALALYHLSNGCSTNRAKLAKPDSARMLVGVIKDKEMSSIAGIALMVMGNISGCAEGRAALMDAGAVEVVIGIIKKLRHLVFNSKGEASSTVMSRMEQSVTVLYGMSKGSLRFRGLAKGAGAEQVLMELVADDEEGETGGGETMEKIKEKARRVLSAIRGQGYTDAFGGIAGNGDARSPMSISSPLMSFPQLQRHDRQHSGVNSSEF